VRFFVVILVAANIATTGFADGNNMKEVLRLLYERASLGAELKLVDGMLSNRAATFIVTDPKGKILDLSLERSRFASLFANATRVKLDTEVLSFKKDSNGVTCHVEQILRVEKVDPVKARLVSLELSQKCTDRWEPGENGVLRITRSQLELQRYSVGPPLGVDPLWPTVINTTTSSTPKSEK